MIARAPAAAYISCSGAAGKRDRRVGARAAEHPREHVDEGRGRRVVGRLVQRRDRQRLPQPLANAGRAGRAGRASRRPFSGVGSAGSPRHDRPRRRKCPVRRAARAASRRATARPSRNTPPSRCSGDGQCGHRSTDRRPSAIEIGHVERRLHAHVRLGADAAEKRERLVIAAEQHVLAVVDQLAGLAIAERRGAPAELAARLEHEHALARARRAPTRRQPGDPGADDERRRTRDRSHDREARLLTRPVIEASAPRCAAAIERAARTRARG